MRLPFIISSYIGKQFLVGLGIVLGILASIILMFDSLEMISHTYGKDVPFAIVIEMVLLRLPRMIQEVLPFAVLIGGILVFSRLTRTSELIVTRAAGVSAWQFLMPAVMVTLVCGIFFVTMINPLSAIMLKRFEQVEGKYMGGTTSMLSVSSSGLWLREKDTQNNRKTIINALRFSQASMELYEVTVFQLDGENKFIRRIEARKAKVGEGAWQMEDVTITAPEKSAERFATYSMPINLVLSQIQDSFAPPETISFWELPGFIETLKEAGFSAQRHVLYWHQMLVSPLLLCAMVLIAASFSLSLPRQGKTGILMMGGIIAGFVVYFITDLVSALGLSGSIPLPLAAWAPVGISMVLGTLLMLHLEDG